MIVEGTAKDYEGFAALAERACAFVDEHEPGMLTYECYADETTRKFAWMETYADAEAFLTHTGNMTEIGVMDEAATVVDFDRVTVLGRVTDPQVNAVIEQFGAATLPKLSGVTR